MTLISLPVSALFIATWKLTKYLFHWATARVGAVSFWKSLVSLLLKQKSQDFWFMGGKIRCFVRSDWELNPTFFFLNVESVINFAFPTMPNKSIGIILKAFHAQLSWFLKSFMTYPCQHYHQDIDPKHLCHWPQHLCHQYLLHYPASNYCLVFSYSPFTNGSSLPKRSAELLFFCP